MIMNKGATQATDVYGIGLVLYEMIFGQPPYYTEDVPKLYSRIKKAKLQFPSTVTPELEDFLSRVLNKDPETRLGGYNKDDLKNHAFFKNIDWNKMFNKEYKAPYIEEEEREVYRKKLRLNDLDYTKENWNHLRIQNFTFVRESEIDDML